MSDAYIKLDNITKVYQTKGGPVMAVDNTTFDIPG
jgi:hypothetical protein